MASQCQHFSYQNFLISFIFRLKYHLLLHLPCISNPQALQNELGPTQAAAGLHEGISLPIRNAVWYSIFCIIQRQIGSQSTSQSSTVPSRAANAAGAVGKKRKPKHSALPKSNQTVEIAPPSVAQQQGMAIMAKIVTLLRNRHLKDRQSWPLSLHESIEEVPL